MRSVIRRWLFLLSLPTAPVFAQEPTYTNRIGMAFVLIKPGRMTVGKFQPTDPPPPTSRRPLGNDSGLLWTATDYRRAKEMAEWDARPGFPVRIARPYYLGKFEVTQAQWKQVMDSNPSVFGGDKVTDADQHPVEQVTWEDVQTFLKKLNAMDKGRRYRLPTEFEWEYAARAGAEDDVSWEDIRAAAQLDARTTSRVGGKTPNAWGLYDTLGNVWEWTQDYYNEKPFADPIPPRSGREHVLKGASFVGDVKNATYLTHAAGPGNGWDVGFRVAMEVE